MPHHAAAHPPASPLAFELSVLRRLRFRSIALPDAGAHACALQLKRRGAIVHAAYTAPADFISGVAHIANNRERLTADDIDRLAADLYVPRHRPPSAALLRRFDEPSAWWFANLRERIANLETPTRRALALDLAFRTARYADAFDDDTSYLRVNLTDAFRRIWTKTAPPVDNDQTNTCTLRPAHEFLAEQRADLALIRLPRFAHPAPNHAPQLDARDSWQTAWLGDEFCDDEAANRTRDITATRDDAPHTPRPAFPSYTSRTQYLHAIENLLARAAHLPQWAIVLTGDGNISAEDFIHTVRRVRAIKTIYTKDFGEWTGTRFHIITA